MHQPRPAMQDAHGIIHTRQRDIRLRHTVLHSILWQSGVRNRCMLRLTAELPRRDSLCRRPLRERKSPLTPVLPLPHTNTPQGRCDGNVGTEIRSWIDEHLALVIGLAAGLGGALILCILCCCWRSYRRRKSRAKYAAAGAAFARGPQGAAAGRRHHRAPPPPPPGQPPIQQSGAWGAPPPYQGQPPMQQGWNGNGGIPQPPPLQHRNSVRYA